MSREHLSPLCLLQHLGLSRALSAVAGFAGVSAPNLGERKCVCKYDDCNHRVLPGTHSAPAYLSKKRERLCSHLSSYGFFLSTSVIIAMQTMIATKSPAMAGRKYKSAADGAGVGCGVAVAAGSEAYKPVDACEL